MNIAIIGGGNLGRALAVGLQQSTELNVDSITVTRRSSGRLKDLEDLGILTSSNNHDAVRNAEIVILSVKPHQIEGVLTEIRADLDPAQHLLISVVTGVSIHKMHEIVGTIPTCRAMPNTAIAIHESMTCLAVEGLSEAQRDQVVALFESVGRAVIINEELMGAATVLGACGTAYALRYLRASAQGGVEIGFGADLAQLIAAQTAKGAARLVLEGGLHPEQEIDKVTTPMGVTISGLNEMEHRGFSSALIKGLTTSHDKISNV
ncbi:MAG: pyrroline-5-carboxylate reductase [Rhodothermales bacterium]|nr:pyrroline-5-carboxylate reductase [Rhodothermales bacterium]